MPRRRELTRYEWKLPDGHYYRNPPEPQATIYRTDRNGFVWMRLVDSKDWVTVSDVAGFLGVNPATAWNWVRAGKLKSRKRRGVIVVRFGDIEQMATERGLYERPRGVFLTN